MAAVYSWGIPKEVPESAKEDWAPHIGLVSRKAEFIVARWQEEAPLQSSSPQILWQQAWFIQESLQRVNLPGPVQWRNYSCWTVSTTHSVEDRVLQKGSGNQTAIAIERVKDLQKMPPAKSSQPRKNRGTKTSCVCLCDMSKLGDTGAIKNPWWLKQ